MNDFGKILEIWEKNKKSAYIDKDRILSEYRKGETSKELIRKKPQGILDLHGLTVEEAEAELDRFLLQCRKMRLKKVLIIHGKGNHSPNGPVLRDAVLLYLRNSPYTGMTGTPDQSQGGSGAVWVIIK